MIGHREENGGQRFISLRNRAARIVLVRIVRMDQELPSNFTSALGTTDMFNFKC